MKPGLVVALRALTALALLAALPALAGPAARRGGHPDVKGEQECATCHRGDTPEAFKAWEDSPHGLSLVKCVVCHGSTGKDFKARPDASGCRGCHPAQVEALARRPVKDCFACHAPHSLASNPHR
jgi:hypothetical protein